MRTIFGLFFITVAAALAVSGAKNLGASDDHSAAYLAGKVIGTFLIPLVLCSIGLRWIRPRKVADSAD